MLNQTHPNATYFMKRPQTELIKIKLEKLHGVKYTRAYENESAFFSREHEKKANNG